MPHAAIALAISIASGSVEVPKFPRDDAGEKVAYRYRLVEPPADAIAEGKRVPLVVFLHGSGERGDDNEKQLVHFVGSAAKPDFQAKAPCFILAPQCPASETWASIDLKTLQTGGTMAFAAEPTRSRSIGLVSSTSSIIASTARSERAGSVSNAIVPPAFSVLRSIDAQVSFAGHCGARMKQGAFDWKSGFAAAPTKWTSCLSLSSPRSPEPCRKTTSGTRFPSAIDPAGGSTRR